MSAPDPELYPVRQGDLVHAPEGATTSKGKPWHAALVVHPSCEIVAKSEPPRLQVVRVYRLAESSAKDQERIVLGMQEVDGRVRVAMAHTFFLAPVPGFDEEPMYADFRQPHLAPREALSADRRLAALTHDTRVSFIRRKLYWEQRWRLDLGDVRGLEASRIHGDVAFVGPKPNWATT